MTAERLVERFTSGLFENGLEQYDSNARNTPTKGVINAGGAKVFFHPKWKTEGKIQVINSDFRNVLMNDLPATLYTLNRIQLDGNKKPVMTKDGTGYNRTHTGLMLYAQFDDAPDAGERIRGRLIEALSKVSDFSNYIEVASKMPTSNVKVLETLKHQDPNRILVPLKLSACVIIAIASGPTNGMWNFQNVRAQSRTAMSAALMASAEEQNDLPL
jgi:hypothetical protein